MSVAEQTRSPADAPDADAVAAAFGLGAALAPVEPNAKTTWQTWRLRTTTGDAFVKQVDCTGWQTELERAMAFERAAAAAGVAMPRALEPVRPAFEYAATVGDATLRAYEWVDGRAVDPGDDLADWLGGTLATLHRVAPVAAAEPAWYGLYPQEQWRGWQRAGRARGQAWAGVLAGRVTDIAELSGRIADTFAGAGDYVLAHQDLRPHNVLVTAVGPVLTDWDSVGPDSAALEAADAIMLLAAEGRDRPSPDVLRAGAAAYRDGGGGRIGTGSLPLARRAGHRLLHIKERIDRALAGSADDERSAAQRLADLPGYVDLLDDWARLLPR